MKNHVKAFAVLAALLAAAPSCSNDDGDDGSGTGDGDGDGDSVTPTAIDSNNDGIPDGIDNDGDGVPDVTGIAIDWNEDGVYDGLDTDGDGVIDVLLPGGTPTGTGGGSGDGDGDGDGCTNTPITNPTNNGMTDVGDDFETCASEAREAEALPADIIFMIDQSISMIDHTVPDNVEGAPTRWALLREAVLEFIRDEGSAGLRVGLQFFPQAGDWQFPDNGGNSGVSCETADYSDLAVPVGVLPDNADALEEAYPEIPQGGFTPSFPSLEGALSAARTWADMPANSGRGVAVVWVTDGYPTVCDDQTISGLADLAESYNNPAGGETRIPTFVVGLGPTANLTTVARAGGTGDGYFVADEECDAVETLLTSLQRVANNPNLCEFNMPVSADGSPIDLDKVNMQFTPLGGSPETIGQTSGPSACPETGGWYYDDPEAPEMIIVCPQSCGNFGGGTVSIVAGCESVTIF